MSNKNEIEHEKIYYSNVPIWKSTKFTVNRELFVSKDTFCINYKNNNIDQPKYKYKEIIMFNINKNIDKETAICIGFNPALAIEELDTTNKRLIVMLEAKGYSGYTLFNLYPEVTAHKGAVNLKDVNNVVHLEYINENLKNKVNDIILFFGRTANLTNELKEFILNLNKKNKIFLTTFNGEFIHPGSIGDFDIKPFLEEYIKETLNTQIRIKT